MLLPALSTFLHSLKLGEPQTAGRLIVFPLHGPAPEPPDYLALAEALQLKQAEITELNEGGSVPDLVVVNHGDKAVLLLDGEELAGAKQNRVLNTTILVAARAKTVIPVSCSEQGRWHYTSASFSSSGNVMAAAIRKKKTRSVSSSLGTTGKFQSNQGEVWSGIADLHEKASTSHLSQTGAMSDVYAAREKDLDALSAAFPATEAQTGVLVLRDGQVEGCDVISRSDVYRQLHDRLVRSYAMEALVEAPSQKPAKHTDSADIAQKFFALAEQAEETHHRSTGLGEDHRLSSSHLAGSALVVDDQVIHMALFADHDGTDDKDKPLASVARRRRYRGL